MKAWDEICVPSGDEMATTGIGIQSLEVVRMACGIHLQALIT